MCLLELFERIAKFMNKWGLIYCSIWGIPYKEGCRRWMELKFTRYIDVLVNNNIVELAVNYNMVLFVLLGCVLGWGIGNALSPYEDDSAIQLVISLSAVFTSLMCFIIFAQPLMVCVDTYFVSFAEDPGRLQTTDPHLYETMCNTYRLCLGNVTPHTPL